MILFHFHVASEKHSKNRETTAGMGHAVRCRAVSNLFNLKSIFCVNRSDEASNYCISHNLDFIYEDNLQEFLRDNPVKVIISDINYLKECFIEIYKSQNIPTVCLAPRGEFKYLASLAFCDLPDQGENVQRESYHSDLKIGFDYVVIRDEIIQSRKSVGFNKCNNKIIISMGGADTFDMTSKVIKNLTNLPDDYNLEIVVGELYENTKALNGICKQHLSCGYNIIRSPENFSHLLGSSTLGIFGSGIVSYEAMFLGVIPLNFGHSEFHTKRAMEIEKKNAGFYIGDFRFNNHFPELLKKINAIHCNKELMRQMSLSAMNTIDGLGLERIAQAIKSKNWI